VDFGFSACGYAADKLLRRGRAEAEAGVRTEGAADLTGCEATADCGGAACLPDKNGDRFVGAKAMRSVLALGLLLALGASTDAATAHRAKPRHFFVRPSQLIVRRSQGVTGGARFAVPGWSDEQTRQWLDSATSCVGCG